MDERRKEKSEKSIKGAFFPSSEESSGDRDGDRCILYD